MRNTLPISLKEFRDEVKTQSFSNSQDFKSIYKKILLDSELTEDERQYILKLAVVLSNFGDLDLQKLGYKLLVSYSNKYNDYTPLYDFAINKGYFPISKFLEKKLTTTQDGFFQNYFSSFHENFKQKNFYISDGQKKLIEFSNEVGQNQLLVAPTSYGKSEIIVNKVFQNLDKKICIIVPSKALLAQTKKRLFEHSNGELQRIVTHPEMYKGTEASFVAVLTQERLLRLLQKNDDLKVDLILVDEAHNLFGESGNDERATLLAQTIIIAKKRNNELIFNFFSPFVANSKNLRVREANYDIVSENTTEYIKSEKYFVCDLYNGPGNLEIYDQFLNDFLQTEFEYETILDLLIDQKAHKNIIYLNRPMHIEELSSILMRTLPDITIDQEIEKTISDFIHPEYNLIKCIKKGIVYHHGGMPEVIRLYVEDIFSKVSALHFIITSSTLLEGVNIPAEKIFLFSTKKGKNTNLTISQFKNLIGRINRFSEIFNPETGNMELLQPKIYIVKNKYENKSANIKKFISDRAKTESQIVDNVNNVLLKDIEDLNESQKLQLNKKLEFLENIEPNCTSLQNANYVQSQIAKLCFQNNIYDFDIRQNERQLVINLLFYKNRIFNTINDCDELLEAIFLIFFKDITVIEENILRLQNSSARRFYSMIINWRSSSASFKEMISSFLRYWERLSGNDLIIYVGSKWGIDKRNFTDRIPLYIDLRKQTISQRVNIAILRIKEEQDFVEFNILKYIDILYELELLGIEFYEKIKYGSADKKTITLLKNGFSIELAKCILASSYENLVSVDHLTDTISIDQNIITEMEINDENRLLIFEIKYHINYN